MSSAQAFFQKYPELAVYLALGIGYAVGGLKLRGFSLGGSTGSLLAGLLIGALLEVPVSATAKSVLFMLFLFAIGYSVGPKFAKSMKGDGWRFAVLGVFVPVVGLLTAWAVASALDLDPGFAGGLVSGALTESPAIGTASEAIQNLGLDDVVQLRGHAHDAANALATVDAFILPSLSESCSNSLMEAMAMGLPVIASNTGGNPELVLDGSSGLLVRPGDPADLARAMAHLMDNSAVAAALGARAAQRARTEFSLSSMLAGIEALYVSTLKGVRVERLPAAPGKAA